MQEHFRVIGIADGSTLEALKKKRDRLKEHTRGVGGKMLLLVEVFTHVPVATWYPPEAEANEKTCWDQLMEQLLVGGLLLFDLGFFRFCRVEAWTAVPQFLVPRVREKTAYRVTTVVSPGPRYREEIIRMGV